jgi:ABC-type transport system involved in multi-copper enzyme maturation permease subunit
MVVEYFPDFLQWLLSGSGGENPTQPALLILAGLVLAGALLGIFFGYLVAAFRHGPFEAFYVVAQVIAGSIPDFLKLSPRRVAAIARLAVKETLRRKVVLVTFGIFALALLFGGWFMNSNATHPDRIYMNFVYWGTQLLVLMMGLLISAFSLPEDIKNRTIYTVVTKPVRPTEVVLGRIVGMVGLGTVLLAAMGLLSFIFVWRGLSHTHRIGDADTQTMAEFYQIDPDELRDRRQKRVSPGVVMAAETETVSGHRHRLEVVLDVRHPKDRQPQDTSNIWKKEVQGDGQLKYYRLMTEEVASHLHRVTVDGEGNDAQISLSNATGYFRARVPIYANSLKFYDRLGELRGKGINIGHEWEYRGYVDGGSIFAPVSLSEAEFEFKDFPKERFGDDKIIPLEMTLGVFRTTKGDIERRVLGSIRFESFTDSEVDSKIVTDPIVFETNEFNIMTLPVNRRQPGQLLSPDGTVQQRGVFDLFDDVGKNGSFRLFLRCEDVNQYLGCARADIYFRANDASYAWNFAKGYLGVWCQLVIVVSMGVAFSTFLNSPVTMFAAFVVLLVGFSGDFIRDLSKPDAEGGGPIESFVRIITQNNMQSPLETGLATTLMEQTDNLLVYMMYQLTYLAPDFRWLDFSDFLTYGYAIDVQRVLVAVSIALGFAAGTTVLGYFCLKTREIAK